MKFFLVIPTLKQGGSERVISELANYFYKNGIEVHLVLLVEAIDFYKVDDRVNIHRLGFSYKTKFDKILSQIMVYIKLRKLFKKNKPDAILSFMDKYNIFTLLASLFLGLNVFISDRSNPNIKLSFINKFLKMVIYPLSRGIVAQTSLAKDVLFDLTKHKNISIIPNPVKLIENDAFIKKEKIILNMGRLVPEKDQENLINIFSLINQKEYKLVILGEGPLRFKIEQKILQLGLEDRVIMPGAVYNVDEWLAKSTLFAFSSVSEGFPNVLVEAMSAGLPCVSFDCDAGPRDIINNGINGFLIDKGNNQLFAEKVNLLLSNKELIEELSLNATKVNEIYSMEKIGQKYLEFIINKDSK